MYSELAWLREYIPAVISLVPKGDLATMTPEELSQLEYRVNQAQKITGKLNSLKLQLNCLEHRSENPGAFPQNYHIRIQSDFLEFLPSEKEGYITLTDLVHVLKNIQTNLETQLESI